ALAIHDVERSSQIGALSALADAADGRPTKLSHPGLLRRTGPFITGDNIMNVIQISAEPGRTHRPALVDVNMLANRIERIAAVGAHGPGELAGKVDPNVVGIVQVIRSGLAGAEAADVMTEQPG